MRTGPLVAIPILSLLVVPMVALALASSKAHSSNSSLAMKS
jgi:hypothetical protein